MGLGTFIASRPSSAGGFRQAETERITAHRAGTKMDLEFREIATLQAE